MSNQGLIDLFQVQFSTVLKMKLQQRTSLLRGKCLEGTHSGAKMASPIQYLAAVQMKTPAGRFADKDFQDNVYTRRWVVPVDKEADILIDNFDQLKTPIDPKSMLAEAMTAACARTIDDTIIDAAFATSTIGGDSGSLSTEAWDTTYQVASDFENSGIQTGLTVAKLNEARRILEHNHAFDWDPQACLVIGSKQHADLRNQALVTSADFNNNGGILVDGTVRRYMGFDVVVSERLQTITDKNSNANCRSCIVFGRQGLYLGMWQDVKIEVLRQVTKSSNPWDVNAMLSLGATRTQLGQVVQVCALDTTGADITF